MLDIFLYAGRAIMPLLLMMALGCGLRRVGRWSDDFYRQLNGFCFHVLLPVQLFLNVYAIEDLSADLPNVDVVPGGDYIISRATFPAYFLQGDPEQARCDLELTLFGKRIAPALGITRRFVGQEPYSPVTARYNQRMQALLPQWGIRVEEIPRLEGISASRVRQLLRQGRLAELQPLVPETTYAYCRDHFGAGAPCP